MSEFDTKHADLLPLEPIGAIHAKWDRGRAEFAEKGFTEYEGGHPIYEAFEEALDLGAYLLMALERTDVDRELCEQLVRDTLNLIRGLKTAAEGIPR